MARGGYTVSDINSMSEEEIAFIYHYQDLAIEKQHSYLASILGVVWTRDDVTPAVGKGSSVPPDKILVPLSMAINPNVVSYVSSVFGIGGTEKKETSSSSVEGYTPSSNEKIVSTEGMGKEEFMKLIGKR